MKKAPVASLALGILATAAAAVWLAGCKPKTAEAPAAPPVPAAPQVPTDSRSAVSTAVASHLVYGGEFFAVVDIKGNLQELGDRVANLLQTTLKQVPNNPNPNLDVHALFDRAGLYGIEGGGLSSWRQSDGIYHNAIFLYMPGGRQGMLKVFGGAPSAFVSPGMAPGDADIAYETTLDLKSIADLAISYARDAGGPEAFQQVTDSLKKPVMEETTLTGQDLIDHANTRVMVIVRADDKQSIAVNATLKMPFVDAVVSIDGFSDVYDKLEPALQKMPFFEFSEKNGMKIATWAFPLPEPWDNYKPQLISDPKSKRLYLATRAEFADAVLGGGGTRLNASDDFKTAVSGLPSEGNGLTYVSKKAFETFLNIYKQLLAADMPDDVKNSVLSAFKIPPHGVASVSANLPDGILEQDNSNQSNKNLVLLAPVAMTGLVAGLAVPAITAARTRAATAQNPALRGPTAQDAAIRSNLRLLANAAQQYMLDNNVTVVRYSDLVGGSGKPIARMVPVDGEDYENIVIREATKEISATTASGHTVIYNM